MTRRTSMQRQQATADLSGAFDDLVSAAADLAAAAADFPDSAELAAAAERLRSLYEYRSVEDLPKPKACKVRKKRAHGFTRPQPPGYVFGQSLRADIDHIGYFMRQMLGRLERGEYIDYPRNNDEEESCVEDQDGDE